MRNRNEQLKSVRDWAQSKIDAGSEPPWAWYQYMKLVETCDAILRGMECTVPIGRGLQLVKDGDAHPSEVQLPF
jgi:hypothetical protein